MFEMGCVDDRDDRIRTDPKTGREYRLAMVRSSDRWGGTTQLERIYLDEEMELVA